MNRAATLLFAFPAAVVMAVLVGLALLPQSLFAAWHTFVFVASAESTEDAVAHMGDAIGQVLLSYGAPDDEGDAP